MVKRTLKDGRTVTARHNDGLRKRCDCARRAWATCEHPWHFSYKWKGVHHRFPIDRYAEQPITTRDEAVDERDRLRRLIRGGAFPPVPVVPVVATIPEQITFETFAERWQSRARASQSGNQQLNEKGIIKRLSAIELTPGERLGARAIGLVTLDDLQLAFGQLTALSGSTWNKYRQALLLMQRWGLKNKYFPHAWITDLKEDLKRQRGAKRERRLTPDVYDDAGKLTSAGEERRLIAVLDPWLQRLTIAAIDTGMRRGELLALTWADVDLARGEITVRAETTKDREQRHVPISPRLKAVLQMITTDPTGEPHKPTARVFGDVTGGAMLFPKKAWGSATRRASIDNLHFHDLRHEAGSRMHERGWPLHHVQVMLGHADVKTTSTYLNVTRHGLHESMKRFGMPTLPDVAQSSQTEPPPAVQPSSANASNVTVN